MSENEIKNKEKLYSRRRFLQNSGITVGGIILGGGIAGLLGTNKSEQVQTETAHTVTEIDSNQALMYLTQEQFKTVEAAAERIFPEDELGPGAKALGAAFFIDHQLASPWGMNAREYKQGPFFPGEPTQGSQEIQSNQDIFMIGLKGLQGYAQTVGNNLFENLSPEEQDQILTDFEDLNGENKVKLSGISSSRFFSMLRELTIEGIYSDPMYGGNKNMGGWKMKNFPGHQMSNINEIEEKTFIKKEPKSLSSMHNHH